MTNRNRKNKDQHLAITWNAGLYLRLSRDDDKYESESISSQREMLLEFVRKNPDIKVYDIYIDDGYSGTNFDRPRFKDMENDLRAKKINCIIVKDLSRFGRNQIEIGNYLTILFPYLKTRFICLNDNVDSYLDPDSLDNISTKFKNLINDEYCRDISIKVKSALTLRRENGEYIGSHPCYGYIKHPENVHKLIIDERVADNVRLIFRMFLGGESIRGIVKYLNEMGILPPALYKKQIYPKYKGNGARDDATWNMRTVRRILTNRMYVGDLVQNVMNNISYRIQKCRPVAKEDYIIVPNTHEAIISREDFDAVQQLLFRDTRVSPKTQQLNVLSGFIKCGDCKRGMIRKKMHSGKKDFVYYYCSTYKNRGRNLCTKHTVHAEKVENAVLAFLQTYSRMALEIEPLLKAINESPQRERTSKRMEEYLKQSIEEKEKYIKLKADLYPDYKAGLIEKDEYETFRRQYEVKIADIETQILGIQRKMEEVNTGISPENQFIKSFKSCGEIPYLTRNVVVAFIENIYVFEDNRIEINLKYRDDYETIIDYLYNNRLIVFSLDQYKNAEIVKQLRMARRAV